MERPSSCMAFEVESVQQQDSKNRIAMLEEVRW
jgi:hypothetical protein